MAVLSDKALREFNDKSAFREKKKSCTRRNKRNGCCRVLTSDALDNTTLHSKFSEHVSEIYPAIEFKSISVLSSELCALLRGFIFSSAGIRPQGHVEGRDSSYLLVPF